MSTYLPLEILRQILVETVRARGIKRALRLRLVSKLFNEEMAEALHLADLYRDCNVGISKMPFIKPYLGRLLTAGRTESHPRLNMIRKAAEQLAADDGVMENIPGYCLDLLSLAARPDRGATHVCLLFGKAPDSWAEESLKYDIITAAAYTKHISLLEQSATSFYYANRGGGVLGGAYRAAFLSNDPEVLEYLFNGIFRPEKRQDYDHRYSLLIQAMNGDDFEIVHKILDRSDLSAFKPYKRRAERMNEKGLGSRRRLSLDRLFRNIPTVEMFDIALSERMKLTELGVKPLLPSWLEEIFTSAVIKGRTGMVRRMISFGAPLNTHLRGSKVEVTYATQIASRYGHKDALEVLLDHGAQIHGNELEIAARYGHASTIKILLERGASVHDEGAKNSLSSAAKNASIGMVRLLLDAGMDVNRGTPPPILCAIESEHSGIVQLLVERGAIVELDVAREARLKAEQDGMETMAE